MKLKIAGAVALVLAGALLFWTVSREDATDARVPNRQPEVANAPTDDEPQPELAVVNVGEAVVCTGHVVDALGQAVGGAKVSAWSERARPRTTAGFWEQIGRQRPARPTAVAESRRDGAFEIRLLKDRPVVLRAETAGAASEPTFRIESRRHTTPS